MNKQVAKLLIPVLFIGWTLICINIKGDDTAPGASAFFVWLVGVVVFVAVGGMAVKRKE